MAKLNQVIAVEHGEKPRLYAEISKLNTIVQKPALFSGLNRTYQKKSEEDEDLPTERQLVQYTVNSVMADFSRNMSALMDITARKDWTNCIATADVSIDGKVMLEKVPVTYLLFLEKQLIDLRTFLSNLPVLDSSEEWKFDSVSGLHKSSEIRKARTKKVQEPIVLFPATPEHPAQTQMITRDITAGYWSEIRQSGAIPKPVATEYLARVGKLINAVKEARETANSVDETKSPKVGAAIFGYIAQGIN